VTIRDHLTRLVAAQTVRASVELDAAALVDAASTMYANGFRLALVAGHDDDDGTLRIVYLFVAGLPDQRIELHVRVARDEPRVPSLVSLSFSAGRFERELHDLFGVEPVGHPKVRPLVLHQHWPKDWHPLRADAPPLPPMVEDAASYPFVDVEGAGVYEIPVGPVHAGVIEPGHFRFWVVGETIVRMKSRLWFTHKGVERLFEGRDHDAAIELAERVSGDTAVGHSLALALATEEAMGLDVAPRTHELRAMLLELERLYNHVADVGALCNDVGFGLAQARALTLRERLLRLNESVTGHRLLRGGVRIGGAELRALPRVEELREIESQFNDIVELAHANSIVMDRFTGTGVLSTTQAREMGLVGVAARASGLSVDVRFTSPFVDLGPSFHLVTAEDGDVLGRFRVRVDEVRVSLAVLVDLVNRSGARSSFEFHRRPESEGHGTGLVEGWRGAVVHRVEVSADGTYHRVKIVDPSFRNWPALGIALNDTIVPDFPLVNKSFNLSYAGNDL
jgi:Ni,Fe-hydrogenase III large subunit/Ni,Fe-hydrogenase III component G